MRLHARVADALEQVAPVAAAELAAQLDAAGGLVDPHRALRYARRAAEEAAARHAFDVAAEHYERARRAGDRLADMPAQQRLELDLAYGRALRLAGDRRAHDGLRRVATDAERAGDGARMAEAVLTLVLGMETDVLTEDREMIGLVGRALTLLPGEDSAARARLEALLALQALYSIRTPSVARWPTGRSRWPGGSAIRSRSPPS